MSYPMVHTEFVIISKKEVPQISGDFLLYIFDHYVIFLLVLAVFGFSALHAFAHRDSKKRFSDSLMISLGLALRQGPSFSGRHSGLLLLFDLCSAYHMSPSLRDIYAMLTVSKLLEHEKKAELMNALAMATDLGHFYYLSEPWFATSGKLFNELDIIERNGAKKCGVDLRGYRTPLDKPLEPGNSTERHLMRNLMSKGPSKKLAWKHLQVVFILLAIGLGLGYITSVLEMVIHASK